MGVLSGFVKGSSSSSSSSSTTHQTYDVFLSFRGTDTRNNIISHLYKALLDANISTFRDDDEIERGKVLDPVRARAIEKSRLSVIVLSNNYAGSSSCLDELLLILEQARDFNQIVIPIYYHVEPSHVRKQPIESTFGVAMAEHRQKMEMETDPIKRSQLAKEIDQWIRALMEVSKLSGFVADIMLETELIEKIVENICVRLHVPKWGAPALLIGMKDSIEFITSWLKNTSSYRGDILTIVGMSGIGKTSLAKYVYGLHCYEFQTSSYIENIGRRCDEKFNRSSFFKDRSRSLENYSGFLGLQKQPGDDIPKPSSDVVHDAFIHTSKEHAVASHWLIDLQKQLYYDITKRSATQVHDVSGYTSKIENVVAHEKIFLVLDDIDSPDQLDALLGSKGFHGGSKIIITTRDARVTESCALFRTDVKPKHVKHMLQGLSVKNSRELLCFHAFRSKDPMAGYEEASKKVMKYCQGHPLALEVLGKSLHNQDVAYWEECIEGLKKQKDSRINSVLRKNFDSLPSENDKELFKHIACFFVGMDRDFTETILEACDIDAKSGITILINRCLLSIGYNNKLQMHDLLQEMGRSLVREEAEQSLFWCHEESFKVLKHKKGTENVLGLTLDMKKLKNEKLHGSFELKTDALSEMGNLMLLQLNYVQMYGSYENFPKKLRWLCMHGHGFPLKSIPSDLPMENLVALDMSYSNIESFYVCYRHPNQPQKRQKLTGSGSNDKPLLGSLKILNLSFCKHLHSLGGFEELPALERLIVRSCIHLVEVCESIEACVELVLIDLSYCKRLEKFPIAIGRLLKLETLFLDRCNLRISKIEIRDVDSRGGIPSDSKFFTISLPRSLVRLSLKNNKMYTESFPINFSCLSMLEELYLDGNPIVSMPDCVRSLPRLEILSWSDHARQNRYTPTLEGLPKKREETTY